MESHKIRALCVFGTRPDAVKMAPVVLELQRHPDKFETIVAVTGQHREQLDQVLRVFGIVPHHDLNIMRHGQTLAQITTRSLKGLDHIIAAENPHVLIAQGDTSTTFVASLAAFYHRIPFAHVEAGLRTDNMYDPFPEEMNRRLTSQLATFHFAPTPQAEANLLREHVPADQIVLSGNTGIDALLNVAGKNLDFEDPVLASLFVGDRKLVLVTAHRRENWGEPLRAICGAVQKLSEEFRDTDFVYAMHLNPAVRSVAQEVLHGVPGIYLVEPPDYAPFVKLMQRSSLILTDSGGVQEEAPSLGVPVLVLRQTTERPEGIEAGVAKLVGTNRETIVAEACVILNDSSVRTAMSRIANPYGDGKAAERIRLAFEGHFLPTS